MLIQLEISSRGRAHESLFTEFSGQAFGTVGGSPGTVMTPLDLKPSQEGEGNMALHWYSTRHRVCRETGCAGRQGVQGDRVCRESITQLLAASGLTPRCLTNPERPESNTAAVFCFTLFSFWSFYIISLTKRKTQIHL